jgi:hypothetical protein
LAGPESLQFQDAKPAYRLQDVLAAHQSIAEWVILDSLMAVDPALGNRSIIDLLKEKDDLLIDQIIPRLRVRTLIIGQDAFTFRCLWAAKADAADQGHS